MNPKLIVILSIIHVFIDIVGGALPAFMPFLKRVLALSYTEVGWYPTLRGQQAKEETGSAEIPSTLTGIPSGIRMMPRRSYILLCGWLR